jgi:hypothetical protein
MCFIMYHIANKSFTYHKFLDTTYGEKKAKLVSRALDALTSFVSEAKAEPRSPGFIKPKKFFGNNFWKDPLSFLKSELNESGNI